MSPKELSYIEDALSHLKEVDAICQSVESEVQSPDFKSVAGEIAAKQQQIYDRMMGLLG